MTQAINKTFSFVSPINMENSFGIYNVAEETVSIIQVVINEVGVGWFEWDIPELGITESGGLWFDENELIEYDGVFELPEQLITFLKELNYNMDYANIS